MNLTTKKPSANKQIWHPLSRKELLWAGVLFAFATLIPAMVFWDQLPCSDDTLPHFYRTVQLDVNLQQGVPLLQWGPEMLRGYGYTIFLFYAPLTYWLLEGIHLLGFDFGPAIQIAFVAVLWLAGWGSYVLARYFLTPIGAFIAGLAYLFAPYILYDAIQRGALPETLALAIAPWALTAALRAFDNPRPQTIALASLLFTALILAHNVVPLFALGLLVLFALIPSATTQLTWSSWVNSLKPVALILVFSLGLTLFFWLPGLVELQYTQSRIEDPIIRDWPRYEQHIIPVSDLVTLPDDPSDENLINPPVPRAIGFAQMVLGLAGMLALLWYKRPFTKRRLILLALVTLAAIFFSVQWSLWGWHHLPLLNFIQMPTRFLGLSSLGLAIFAGVAIDQLTQWFVGKWQTAVIIFIAALAVSMSGWAWLYPHKCPVPVNPTRNDLAQATVWSRWYAEAQGELLPRWVQALPPEDTLIPQFAANGDINRLQLPESANLQSWDSEPAGDSYQLELAEPTTLIYQVFYFPGWSAKVNGQPQTITPSVPEGFIQLDLPAGDHNLDIQFGLTPVRFITLLLSGLTAVLLIIWVWRQRQQNPPPPPAALSPTIKQQFPLFFLTILIMILIKVVLVDRLPNPMRDDRLQNGQLANVTVPADVRFDNEFINLGIEGPSAIVASDPFVLTQYWAPLQPIGVPYGFSLEIVDANGRIWNDTPGRPFNYLHFPATEAWEPDQYARDAYDLRLLPGTPPGTYAIETAVFRRDIDQSLIPQNGTIGSAPDRAQLGLLEVTEGNWEVDEQNSQVATFKPTPIPQISGLTLLGWTIPEIIWRPGEVASLDLLWQGKDLNSSEPIEATLQLRDEAGVAVAETAVLLGGDNYPTTAWSNNALIRDKIQWRLPPKLESGQHKIILTVADEEIPLGSWQIDAPNRNFNLPEFSQIADFQADFAQLVGYDLSDTAVSPNTPIELTLIWQAVAETETSYRVFVHLLDENGSLITQSDAIPDNWTRPTTGWVTGEYIADRHTFIMPGDASLGMAQLVVGLYDPSTGARLGETTLQIINIEEN